MTRRIPLFPYTFGKNHCYRFIMDEFNTHQQELWRAKYLFDNFGSFEVQEIIEEEYLVRTSDNQNLRLAFRQDGTAPADAVKYASREIHFFLELLSKLTPKSHYSKQRLRHCLAFLCNFKQVQVFPLPGSSITCIAADNDSDMDKLVNRAFKIVEALPEPFRLEAQFVYQNDIHGLDSVDEELSKQIQALTG